MILEKLKNKRVTANMTYQEVADEIGISKEYYWMIENGKRKLSYPNAVKIAKVFDSKPDDIFLNKELTTSELKKNEEVV